jgi:hypothetical protein
VCAKFPEEINIASRRGTDATLSGLMTLRRVSPALGFTKTDIESWQRHPATSKPTADVRKRPSEESKPDCPTSQPVGLRVTLKEFSTVFSPPQKNFKARGVIVRRKTLELVTRQLGKPGRDRKPKNAIIDKERKKLNENTNLHHRRPTDSAHALPPENQISQQVRR